MKMAKRKTAADEPASIARAGREKEAPARLDRDELLERVAELEKRLAVTTALGQQIELQRNLFVKGAASGLGIVKLLTSGRLPLDESAEAVLALATWLAETAQNVIEPVPWPGVEPTAKH